MAEFLLELGIECLGGLLQGYLEMLGEQWKRPPYIDLNPR